MMMTLQPVLKKNEKILYNLFSLYLHDLSKYTMSLELEQDGSFKFDVFDKIWVEKGLSPYFIMNGNSIVGFTLILERPFLKKEYDYAINDIFILNKFRGKGFGVRAVIEVFQQKKGKYFVIELAANEPAIAFWRNLYKKLGIVYNEQETMFDEDFVYIQTFEIK